MFVRIEDEGGAPDQRNRSPRPRPPPARAGADARAGGWRQDLVGQHLAAGKARAREALARNRAAIAKARPCAPPSLLQPLFCAQYCAQPRLLSPPVLSRAVPRGTQVFGDPAFTMRLAIFGRLVEAPWVADACLAVMKQVCPGFATPRRPTHAHAAPMRRGARGRRRRWSTSGVRSGAATKSETASYAKRSPPCPPRTCSASRCRFPPPPSPAPPPRHPSHSVTGAIRVCVCSPTQRVCVFPHPTPPRRRPAEAGRAGRRTRGHPRASSTRTPSSARSGSAAGCVPSPPCPARWGGGVGGGGMLSAGALGAGL